MVVPTLRRIAWNRLVRAALAVATGVLAVSCVAAFHATAFASGTPRAEGEPTEHSAGPPADPAGSGEDFFVRLKAVERRIEASREAGRFQEEAELLAEHSAMWAQILGATHAAVVREHLLEKSARRTAQLEASQQELVREARARLARGKCLTADGELGRAVSLLRGAHPTLTQCLGADDAWTMEVTVLLSDLNLQGGEYEEARRLASEVAPCVKALYGQRAGVYADVLQCLGMSELELGHLDAADAALTQSLEIYQLYKGDSEITAGIRAQLSRVHNRRKQYVKAEEEARAAASFYSRLHVLRATHSASCLSEIARSCAGQGRQGDAMAASVRAIKWFDDIGFPFGGNQSSIEVLDTHAELLRAANRVAEDVAVERRAAEARTYLRARAGAFARGGSMPPFPKAVVALLDRFKELEDRQTIAANSGRYAEERDATAELLRMLTPMLGAEHDMVRLCELHLRSAERRTKLSKDEQAAVCEARRAFEMGERLSGANPSAALPDLSEANTVFARLLGKEDVWYIESAKRLATVESEMGLGPSAIQRFTEILRTAKALCGEDSSLCAEITLHLGMCHGSMGAYDLAEQKMREALPAIELREGADSDMAVVARHRLAQFYNDGKQFGKAREQAEKAVMIYWRRLPDEALHYAGALWQLARSHEGEGKGAEALAASARAVEVVRLCKKPDPVFLGDLLEGHARLLRRAGRAGEAEAALRELQSRLEQQRRASQVGDRY